MAMIFCDKCGSVMFPAGKKLICRKCKTYKLMSKQKEKTFTLKEKIKHSPDDEVYTYEEEATFPTTDEECPSCGNQKAYYWFEQTRSLDEPSTRFFRCTACKHTWREYS